MLRVLEYRLCVGLVTFTSSIVMNGQSATFKLHVLNGRTDQPISNTEVVFHDMARDPTPLTKVTTDSMGFATVELPSDAIVRPFISMHETCAKKPEDFKIPIAGIDYPVREIEMHGMSTSNTCGKFQTESQARTLTLYFRDLHWWEKLHD